jgi:hypothetical protein
MNVTKCCPNWTGSNCDQGKFNLHFVSLVIAFVFQPRHRMIHQVPMMMMNHFHLLLVYFGVYFIIEHLMVHHSNLLVHVIINSVEHNLGKLMFNQVVVRIGIHVRNNYRCYLEQSMLQHKEIMLLSMV